VSTPENERDKLEQRISGSRAEPSDPVPEEPLITDEQFESTIHKSLVPWIHPFTRFHHIPVFKRIWLFMALMAAYTALVHWFSDGNIPTQNLKEVGAAAYSSVIIGLLLVFRTNAAYERWSEGRRLWGQLVNDSRNLSLKVRSFVPAPDAEKARLGKLVISFAYALKHHLRDSRPGRHLPGVEITGEKVPKNLPVHLAGQIYEMVLRWQQQGIIDGFILLQLDTHVRSYMDICGACERIRSTPLAISYRAFLRQGIALNLLALPWYASSQISIWWSMPLVLIGSYFLIGLELIAEDIEDPFGYDGDDLPLDTICANIHATVSDILPVPRAQKFTTAFKAPSKDPLKH